MPHNEGFTTEQFWQAGVDWIWDAFFFSLKAFNVFLITQILMPMKSAYLNMPVAATLLLVVGTAYIVTGLRSTIFVAVFLLFIALTDGGIGR